VTPIDYMLRPEELAKSAALATAKGEPVMPNGSFHAFQVMADGDDELFEVMWRIWNFEHAFDDLLDETGINQESKELALAILETEIERATSNQGGRPGHLFYGWWHTNVQAAAWPEERNVSAHDAMWRFFDLLANNPFCRQYRLEMRTLLVQCLIRCHAGDMMAAHADPAVRALAPAVRCADVDLFMHLIYLKRGFAAAITWSSLRDYDAAENPCQPVGLVS